MIASAPRGVLRMLAGAVALAALATACGSSDSGSSSEGAGDGTAPEVNVPLNAPLAVIDPSLDTAAGSVVYSALFQGLDFVATNAETGPIPDSATSWETSADGLTWTFALDPDAKFSDGTSVTSADVLFTFEKEMAVGSPHAGNLSGIESVEAPDPATFVFHLKKPNAAFLAVSNKAILPAEYYKRVGPDGFSKAPMGSGPFKFDSLVDGGGVSLVPNPYYTRVKEQYYSRITYTPVTSPAAQVAALQSGSLDIVPNVAASQVDSLKGNSNLKIEELPGGGVSFVAFDDSAGPTSDVMFRKAVSQAIDRDAIVDAIVSGHAQPANGVITPPVYGYDSTRKAPTFNVEQAKKDLKASSYKGETIDFTYPTTVLVNADLMAQAIASFLGDIGIKVNMIPLDYTTFLRRWGAAPNALKGMYLMQYTNGSDPDTILQSLAAPDSHALFVDDEVFDALQVTRSTQGDERKTALNDLQDLMINEKAYYAPVIVPNAIYGVRKDVPFTPNQLLPMYIKWQN